MDYLQIFFVVKLSKDLLRTTKVPLRTAPSPNLMKLKLLQECIPVGYVPPIRSYEIVPYFRKPRIVQK